MGNRRDTTKYSKATFACVCFLVSTVVLYLYFLNMSVVQVVMRTEHVQAQRELNAEIALLEAKYIEAQHTVAGRIAVLDGYNVDSEKVFVSRDQSTGLVLSAR